MARPNRATGSRASLMFMEETEWGVVAVGHVPRGLDFVSETLRNEINPVESQLIRSNRMRQASQQGNQRPGGDINLELQPKTLSLFLKHVLGGSVVTTGSNPYVHTMKGSLVLPEGLSIQKTLNYKTGSPTRLQFLGCRVNEFFLSIPSEGIVSARASVIARECKTAMADLGTPVYAAQNEAFNAFQCALLYDGSAIATMRSLDLAINNGIDPEQFAIDGDAFRADAPEDVRTISGNGTAMLTPENVTLFYDKYVNNTDAALRITMTRGVNVLQITIPKLRISGDVTPQVPGRGPLDISFSFQAHEDEAQATDILVSLTNNEPVISTAA